MNSRPNSASPSAEGSPAIRYFNNAATALNLLYEAALTNDGALQELRDLADRLLARAGNWVEIKYAAEKGPSAPGNPLPGMTCTDKFKG